jgi:hypothetical protein
MQPAGSGRDSLSFPKARDFNPLALKVSECGRIRLVAFRWPVVYTGEPAQNVT